MSGKKADGKQDATSSDCLLMLQAGGEVGLDEEPMFESRRVFVAFDLKWDLTSLRRCSEHS